MAIFWKTAQRPTSSTSSDGNSVTETSPCEKVLRLRVTPDTIAPLRASVVAEFQREAALPGFRKGKAPAQLVEQQYAESIKQELFQRATRQALDQATNEYQLKPVGPFEVTRADLSEADGFILEATVEVEPSFPLASYKDMPLKAQPLTVTPQELEQAMTSLQDSMAQLVPVEEGKPKERKVPALDDELAKDLGFDTLPKLREHVEAKLREQKRTQQTQQQETAVCDELLTRHTFTVPERLVSRQTQRLTREFKARLLLGGTPEEKLDEAVAKFTEQLRTSAQRQVKLTFILDRIATQESITVSEDALVGRLWQLSQRWKKDPHEVRKIFDAQQLWPSVVSAIRQEKTIAFLKSVAKLETQ